MNLASKLFKGDLVIWIIFMFLCLISAVEVFSASSTLAYKSAAYWEPIADHTSFLLSGFVIVLLLHNIQSRFYTLLAAGVAVSVVLLVLLLLRIPGLVVVINGEPRWMNILGVTFQPSEIAKISLMAYTAFILSKRNWFTDKRMFWWIQGAAMLICGLIFITNASTAILLFTVVQMMVFFGQISFARLLKFWGIIVAAIILMVALLMILPDSWINRVGRLATMKARIERFFGRDSRSVEEVNNLLVLPDGRKYDVDKEDHQVVHGKIALARGGLWGKFPGHGLQREFLPQAYSDFIYAIIIEELGIVGGIFVLFLYIALLVRVGMIARKCDKLFPKFLVLGCGLMIVSQALINMAVAVDLIPVTGQPLPLVSRGGTSTIISCAYIGIILSVSRFSAGMGNEDEPDEPASDENPMGMEPETDGHGTENGPASVGGDTPVLDGTYEVEKTNPLEAVAEPEEKTITETKI